MARKQPQTNMRLELRHKDGTWGFLYYVDFQTGLRETETYKARGYTVRMKSEGNTPKTPKPPKHRTDHRAVR